MYNYKHVYGIEFSNPGYNVHGAQELRYRLAIDNIKKHNVKTLVDIGTGRGSFLKTLKDEVPNIELTSYDLSNYHNLSYVRHFDFNLVDFTSSLWLYNFDYLTCLDCLEHIEESKLQEIVNKFSKMCKYASISVANHPSKCQSGYELHLTQRDMDWWTNLLSQKFNIISSGKHMNNYMYFYELAAID